MGDLWGIAGFRGGRANPKKKGRKISIANRGKNRLKKIKFNWKCSEKRWEANLTYTVGT